MPSHFQWILNCTDNDTSFTLTNDPVNWADCVYTLQRHPVYRGIFHQFTSMLKFHPDGGGKQFIDSIYQAFDIDGNIYITINIDSTGTGDYVLLFQGKLNLASYTTDGTITSVNIEQSDLLVKLNTRADIPVALNLAVIKGGYYSATPGPPVSPAPTLPSSYPPNGTTFIQTTFIGLILDNFDPSSDSSPYIFSDPLIIRGYTYVAQTLDTNLNPVTATVYYDGVTNPNNGNQVQPNTGLELQLSIVSGQMVATFTNLVSPVYLYQVSSQQLSIGQQHIQSVLTDTLELPGIPVKYESEFILTGGAFSGAHAFQVNSDQWSPANPLANGQVLSVVSADLHGNIVYDQLTIGSTPQGAGATSTDGLTTIRILGYSVANNTVTVAFNNAAQNIDLFIGTLAGGGSSVGTNLPANPIATYAQTGTGTGATQSFSIVNPDSSYHLSSNPNGFAGAIVFGGDTLFDNLNDFVLASFNNIDMSGPSNTSDSIPPICSGITGAYTTYPVQISYSISMKGTISDLFPSAGPPTVPNRSYTVTIFFAYGGGQTTGNQTPLSQAKVINLGTWGVNTANPTSSQNFNIDPATTPGASGTFELQEGDQIWLFAYVSGVVTNDFGTTLDYQDMQLSFNFTESDVDFQVLSIAPPTTAETVLVHEAFNQVVDAIADTDGNFYSTFYGRTNSQKVIYPSNGPGSLRALTNGLCIRGYTSKYITMSLTDIFTAMAAIDNIGLTVNANNQVQVEALEFFFDPTNEMIVLPNVNAYEQTNENSLYLNQVEVGYDKFETELYFKNGLDEIHATRNYGTRVGAAKGTILQNWSSNTAGYLKVANKLNAVSAFIAGNYTIELTRRKNLAFSNDDFKYDNDNFIICLANTYHGYAQLGAVSIGGFLTEEQSIVLNGPNPGFQTGDSITVSGTLHNNNTYTIIGTSVFTNPGNGQFTILKLAQALANETVASITIVDNTTFFLETAQGLLQSDLTGVYDPALSRSWLNMSITPARMLQNHANEITAGMQIIKGKIQFISGKGNYEAASRMFATGQQQDYNGNLLSESASLQWNDPNVENITPLWGTQIYKFDYPLTYQQFQAILQNPNGYITFFKFANYPMYGFIMSMEYNLKTGMTSFELLQMYTPPQGLNSESGGGIIIGPGNPQPVINGEQQGDSEQQIII